MATLIVATVSSGCLTAVDYRIDAVTQARVEDRRCAEHAPRPALRPGERCVHVTEVHNGGTFLVVAGVIVGLLTLAAVTSHGGE